MLARLGAGKPVFSSGQPHHTAPSDSNADRQAKMILTNCAACAAPLAHDAPRCVRCETKALLRKTIPVARRVLGESHILTLRMRCIYTEVLYEDPAATLDDLREAVTTLEDAKRIARRVLGGAHPITESVEVELRKAQAALRAREAPPSTA